MPEDWMERGYVADSVRTDAAMSGSVPVDSWSVSIKPVFDPRKARINVAPMVMPVTLGDGQIPARFPIRQFRRMGVEKGAIPRHQVVAISFRQVGNLAWRVVAELIRAAAHDPVSGA